MLKFVGKNKKNSSVRTAGNDKSIVENETPTTPSSSVDAVVVKKGKAVSNDPYSNKIASHLASSLSSSSLLLLPSSSTSAAATTRQSHIRRASQGALSRIALAASSAHGLHQRLSGGGRKSLSYAGSSAAAAAAATASSTTNPLQKQQKLVRDKLLEAHQGFEISVCCLLDAATSQSLDEQLVQELHDTISIDPAEAVESIMEEDDHGLSYNLNQCIVSLSKWHSLVMAVRDKAIDARDQAETKENDEEHASSDPERIRSLLMAAWKSLYLYVHMIRQYCKREFHRHQLSRCSHDLSLLISGSTSTGSNTLGLVSGSMNTVVAATPRSIAKLSEAVVKCHCQWMVLSYMEYKNPKLDSPELYQPQ